MGEFALAVKREVLFKDGFFEGFLPLSERDFISVIKENHDYYPRGDELESNQDLQQIIPYVWIVNKGEKKVFLYKRSVNQHKQEGDYVEKRYFNKYSGGVGGHIDKGDDAGDLIVDAMMREIKEEVLMDEYPEPKFFGYINDDSADLERVHFGVVSIVETDGDVKTIEEEGLSGGKFYSVDEADSVLNNPENGVENWTQISWPFVKEYLKK